MAEMLFTSGLYGIAEGVSPWLLQRKQFHSEDSWKKMLDALRVTKTLYVGNLSFYTTEEQIYELVSRCGPVKRVIMGLNKFNMTPCGFCFVEYYNHADAVACKKHLSGTKLDDRVIRADLDPGFEEGRQFGRSQKTGGQIRDDHRSDYDSGRGGWGARSAPEQKSSFIPMSRGYRGGGGNRDRRDGGARDGMEDDRGGKRQKVTRGGDVSNANLVPLGNTSSSSSSSDSQSNGTSDNNNSSSSSSSNNNNGGSSDAHMSAAGESKSGTSKASGSSGSTASDESQSMDESSSELPTSADTSNPRFREQESDED